MKRKRKKLPLCFFAVILAAALAPTMVLKVSAADLKFNMSYIYFGSRSAYASYVDRTQGSLSELSPNYFNLNADGSLSVTAAADSAFAATMHARGVQVAPFLSNHWNRTLGRAALANRKNLAREIAAAVSAYHLDGVNVDLENLTSADRDAYSDFVRLLRESLPAGKTLSVAVAANPWGVQTGWQGSYDYAALAKYSDYLMIMAYDEHYDSGPPGAVASLSFVEKSIQYALLHVPKDKIVLGLAFYGRIWRNGGGSPAGYGLSHAKTEELIRSYRGKVTFDTKSRTPYAVLSVYSNETPPSVGGSALAPGQYTIWYENEASIKEKLLLVPKYGLKGTGSWSLGQETASTWNYYRLWLNGCTFYDVQGHWATDSILTAFQKGWVQGVTPTAFRPERPLTRAEAAVMLVRAYGLHDDSQPSTFADTAGHWARSEIETARRFGLVNGVGGNLFAPDRFITREQMAVLIGNILFQSGELPAGSNRYSDVSETGNPWSFKAVTAVSGLSLLSGFPDGSFRPSQPLLRAQMVSILERLTEVKPSIAFY